MKMSDEKLNQARRIARLAGAPMPDLTPCDKKALDFLDSIYYAHMDLMSQGEPDDARDEANRYAEYADGVVPIGNYSRVNAYAQLALYNYEESEYIAGLSPFNAITRTLYDFALNALVVLAESSERYGNFSDY